MSKLEYKTRKINHPNTKYNNYIEENPKSSGKSMKIFISSFVFLLIIFLAIAKQITPDVDVSIGGQSDKVAIQEQKAYIDERLKLLQEEDETLDIINEQEFSEDAKEEFTMFKSNDTNEVVSEEEPVVLETKTLKSDVIAKEYNHNDPLEVMFNKPRDMMKQTENNTTELVSNNIATKVVVGYYTSRAQAEVAKDIILESGLNIDPFIRTIGGAYTVQVGSYSTKELAQNVVDELKQKSFPARILVEM
ncbi:MAG: SPOR domain-containing protein [Candidatus Gastranaerophilales bacterium]